MKKAVVWLWRRVVPVWTDVSEERIASNFRVVESASEELVHAGSSITDLQELHGVTTQTTAFYTDV
jgi:hypothetical protein